MTLYWTVSVVIFTFEIRGMLVDDINAPIDAARHAAVGLEIFPFLETQAWALLLPVSHCFEMKIFNSDNHEIVRLLLAIASSYGGPGSCSQDHAG